MHWEVCQCTCTMHSSSVCFGCFVPWFTRYDLSHVLKWCCSAFGHTNVWTWFLLKRVLQTWVTEQLPACPQLSWELLSIGWLVQIVLRKRQVPQLRCLYSGAMHGISSLSNIPILIIHISSSYARSKWNLQFLDQLSWDAIHDSATHCYAGVLHYSFTGTIHAYTI